MAVLLAVVVWAAYIALEPSVRRRWPHTLISWNRLLSGQYRDPLVGQHVLTAVGLGLLLQILYLLSQIVSPQFSSGANAALPHPALRFALGDILTGLASFATMGMGLLLFFFCLLLIVRWRWIAITIVLLFFMASQGASFGGEAVHGAYGAAAGLIMLFGLLRFGLLVVILLLFTMTVVDHTPLTLNPSLWYAPASYLALGTVAALVMYGLRTSIAGQPVLGALLDE
jgi:serine/threonine-protein kinase